MLRIQLLLTFDYELPLGGITKSFRHSLFDPSDRLLEVLDKLNIPAVFFVDILSYVRFRELGETDYVQGFENQIKKIVSAGHDVQLHLHPHWLESNYKQGIIIPSSKFKLSDFSSSEASYSIEKIVALGINALTKLCKQANPAYRCIAYRAGGYNFEPQTNIILKALYKYGIRIDSSVSRGYFFKSNISKVDYREVPELPNWYLSFDGNFRKPASNDNSIFEIPIASKPKGLFEVPTAFKLKKYAGRAVENRGPMMHTNEKTGKKDKIRQMFSSRMLTVDNYTFSPDYLLKILNHNVSRFKNHDKIILSLIGHPKSMDKYNYFLLSEFVRVAKEKYGTKLKFVTTADVGQDMRKGTREIEKLREDERTRERRDERTKKAYILNSFNISTFYIGVV